jgi:hypothetical protein
VADLVKCVFDEENIDIPKTPVLQLITSRFETLNEHYANRLDAEADGESGSRRKMMVDVKNMTGKMTEQIRLDPSPDEYVHILRLYQGLQRRDFAIIALAVRAIFLDGEPGMPIHSFVFTVSNADLPKWPLLACAQLAVAAGHVRLFTWFTFLGVYPSLHLPKQNIRTLDFAGMRPCEAHYPLELLCQPKSSVRALATLVPKEEIVKLLLSPEHGDESPEKLMKIATRTSCIEMASYILHERYGFCSKCEDKFNPESDCEINYQEHLMEDATLIQLRNGCFGSTSYHRSILEDSVLGIPPSDHVLAREKFTRQMLAWGMPVDELTHDRVPLLAAAIRGKHPSVVRILTEQGADPLKSYHRGRTALLDSVEMAFVGFNEPVVILTEKLDKYQLAAMLVAPCSEEDYRRAPPRTPDGLIGIPLVHLRRANRDSCFKALNGLIMPTESRTIHGRSKEVIINMTPVDVPGGGFGDDIDTVFEAAVIEKDVPLAGHPVLSTYVDLKFSTVYNKYFYIYLGVFVVNVVSALLVDTATIRSDGSEAPSLASNPLFYVVLVSGFVNAFILLLRMLSQGFYYVTLAPWMVNLYDYPVTLLRSIWYRSNLLNSISANMASEFGYFPGDTGSTRQHGTIQKIWTPFPRALVISGWTLFNGIGLGLQVYLFLYAILQQSGAVPVEPASVQDGAIVKGSFMEATVIIQTISIALIIASGGFFMVSSRRVGSFIFALVGMAKPLFIFLIIEAVMIFLWASTLFMWRRGNFLTEPEGPPAFWVYCLWGLLIMFEVDITETFGIYIEADLATNVLYTIMYAFQVVVMMNILVAVLAGSWENAVEMARDLYYFARLRLAEEIESVVEFVEMKLMMRKQSNSAALAYPPFGLDQATRKGHLPNGRRVGLVGSKWVPDNLFDLPEGHMLVQLTWEDWMRVADEEEEGDEE